MMDDDDDDDLFCFFLYPPRSRHEQQNMPSPAQPSLAQPDSAQYCILWHYINPQLTPFAKRILVPILCPLLHLGCAALGEAGRQP